MISISVITPSSKITTGHRLVSGASYLDFRHGIDDDSSLEIDGTDRNLELVLDHVRVLNGR